MISEKILVNPENKKIEDTITLTYDQRFIRRKKLVSDNNFGFLVKKRAAVASKLAVEPELVITAYFDPKYSENSFS